MKNKSYKIFNLITLTVIILIFLAVILFRNSENFKSNKKNKVVIILHTEKSYAFANKICSSINVDCKKTTTTELKNTITKLKNKNIVVHPRTATPFDTDWINYLKMLENNNVKVINPPRLLQLTSNKLECSFVLYNSGINHPKTWEGKKDKKTVLLILKLLKKHKYLIIKPSNSISQGAYVEKLNQKMNFSEVHNKIKNIPSDPFVIQEYIDYVSLYRVIVINGKALPYSFIDKPTKDNWKVSVCLNKTRMKFVANPPKKILKLGEKTQRILNNYIKSPYKGIHFIDIFETRNKQFTISEINTACSLFIHEKLAKDAGHPDWEISKHIANYFNNL